MKDFNPAIVFSTSERESALNVGSSDLLIAMGYATPNRRFAAWPTSLSEVDKCSSN